MRNTSSTWSMNLSVGHVFTLLDHLTGVPAAPRLPVRAVEGPEVALDTEAVPGEPGRVARGRDPVGDTQVDVAPGEDPREVRQLGLGHPVAFDALVLHRDRGGAAVELGRGPPVQPLVLKRRTRPTVVEMRVGIERPLLRTVNVPITGGRDVHHHPLRGQRHGRPAVDGIPPREVHPAPGPDRGLCRHGSHTASQQRRRADDQRPAPELPCSSISMTGIVPRQGVSGRPGRTTHCAAAQVVGHSVVVLTGAAEACLRVTLEVAGRVPAGRLAAAVLVAEGVPDRSDLGVVEPAARAGWSDRSRACGVLSTVHSSHHPQWGRRRPCLASAGSLPAAARALPRMCWPRSSR